ncbi:MAG: SUMF1/EgtB/PvdO family nonheme iron enzyme [Planctomycetes bacterium]|nr:SUMF1/EgtB/PvdO family nonheme iron enzyme [Planctomycetota bacterium]
MIFAVAFSPEGERFATGDSAGNIWLWDVASLTTLWRRSELAGSQSLKFSPDGTLLAAAGFRGLSDIILLDASTGEDVGKFVGHGAEARSIDFSRDGRMIASGSDDNTLRLWDAATCRQWLVLDHPAKVRSVSVSPCGGVVASGCEDHTVRLWSTRTGQLLATLADHDPPVAFAPAGDILATCGQGKTICLWDVRIAEATPGAKVGQPKRESSQPSTETGAVAPRAKPGQQPALAVAPFDAATAKMHQQAWAGYLGVPVKEDVDLGDEVSLTMVLIPPGEFMMGSTAEEQVRFVEEAKASEDEEAVEKTLHEMPQHRVRITRPFALGRHEVTRGQFRQFVEAMGYKTEAEHDGKGGYGHLDGKLVQDPRFVWSADPGFPQTDDHPVVNVSWNDAMVFCRWLSEKHGVKYDLPTEAQWEYACRAGTTTLWHFGDSDTTLREYAWYYANAGGKTHPVGQLKPNAWGLYDMHGNAWEWCEDWHGADSHAQALSSDPRGPTTGSRRVYHSGGWGDRARLCQSAIRLDRLPGYRYRRLGFRLACEIPDAPDGKTVAPQTTSTTLPGERQLSPDAPSSTAPSADLSDHARPDSALPGRQPQIPSGPPRYLAIWVRNVPRIDWKAAYDLDEADLQKTLARYARLGYAPSCISGYSGKGDRYSFAAVWIKKPSAIEVVASHSLDPAERRRQQDDLAGRGFHPVWFDVYGQGPEWRYATVWVRDNGNVVWRVENYDVNPGDAAADQARQASWDSLIAAGYLPRVSSAHVDSSGVFHQIQIWHEEDCLHAVWLGDFGAYQAKLDEYKSGDQGPVYVESNANGSNVYFAQIERASAGVEWTTTASLDGAEFQRDFDRLSKDSYRPTVVSVR